MCSVGKDHHMTSIFVLYTLVSRRWVTRVSAIQQKSFTSSFDWSWLPSFSTLWQYERTQSRLDASSTKLKLQSCPNVMRSQSGMCYDFSESTVALIWYESDILDCINLNLSWLSSSWSDHETQSRLPWNPRVFACKTVWFADWYKMYVSGNVYPFDADREIDRYFARVKYLTRSGTLHLFFETYHFCCVIEESIRSVLLSQTSLTQREIS
jgi:hypothetical protein